MTSEELLSILKQGVEAWNAWREDYPDIEVDLCKADLAGADLAGANLSKVQLRDADLRKADLSGTYLRGAWLYAAKLHKVNLCKADLVNANLENTDLQEADLRGANLGCADLHYADLRGVIKDDATNMRSKWRLVWQLVNQGGKDQDLHGTDLSRTRLCGVNLNGANLSGAHLNGTDLTDAHLQGTKLIGADLKNVRLSGANLKGADLRRANLSETRLYDVNLNQTDLCEADLCKSELRDTTIVQTKLCSAKLCSAKLVDVHFNESDIEGADMRKANLSRTRLFNTNLQNVNLAESRLSEVEFRGSSLYGANLTKTCIDRTNLSGVALTAVNLSEVDLSHRNLAGLNLEKAILIGVNFAGSNLCKTIFTEAVITGTCLYGTSRDDWIIDGIQCDYVYWDADGKKRAPLARDFHHGEFEDLYKQLPTFEYVFEHGFTAIDTVVMNHVVEAINEQYPELNLDLINFDKRGKPHATFTILRKDDIETAKAQVTAIYERRIFALEAQKEQLMDVIKMLGSGAVLFQPVDNGVNLRHTLSPSLTHQIVKFLCSLPGLKSEDARQAWVYSAGLDASLQQQIQFGGAPIQFFQLLVHTAVSYGSLTNGLLAIEAVLNAAKGMIGADRQGKCDTLIQQVQMEFQSWDTIHDS